MLTRQTFTQVVRASAWYDLAISSAFATPPTLAVIWAVLRSVQHTLGLGALAELDVYGVLFANFFGTVVVIWSIIRLRGERELGRFDAIARFAFSAWMVVALVNGATPLLYGFLVPELAFGIAQALPVRSIASTSPGVRPTA